MNNKSVSTIPLRVLRVFRQECSRAENTIWDWPEAMMKMMMMMADGENGRCYWWHCRTCRPPTTIAVHRWTRSPDRSTFWRRRSRPMPTHVTHIWRPCRRWRCRVGRTERRPIRIRWPSPMNRHRCRRHERDNRPSRYHYDCRHYCYYCNYLHDLTRCAW